MARTTKKAEAAATETAQEAKEQQNMSQGVQEEETIPEAAQGTSFGSAERPSRQPSAAQETQENRDVPQGVQEEETIPEAAQGMSFGSAERPSRQPSAAQEDTARVHEIIGPEDPMDLLGSEELDEAELAEAVLHPYAVAVEPGLNLRKGPTRAAPIIAELPCGVGVFATGISQGEWCEVVTGRLEGWVMAKYLEPLPLPELAYGAE